MLLLSSVVALIVIVDMNNELHQQVKCLSTVILCVSNTRNVWSVEIKESSFSLRCNLSIFIKIKQLALNVFLILEKKKKPLRKIALALECCLPEAVTNTTKQYAAVRIII